MGQEVSISTELDRPAALRAGDSLVDPSLPWSGVVLCPTLPIEDPKMRGWASATKTALIYLFL